MRKLIFSILSVCISANAFCQTDSVYLNNNSGPILGRASINYKKEKVEVKTADRAPTSFPFHEVRKVSSSNGNVYVRQDIKSRTELLLLLSEGKFSLLFNENDKLFYIRKNDSLFVIPQAHFQRALPLIFGEDLTKAYYTKSNTAPQYKASYLRKLSSHANEINHSPETVYQQAVGNFKTTLSLGPYVGFGYNRIAYDLYWENIKGVSIYKKSDFYSSNSVPVGLSVNVGLFKRFSIRMDAYYNQTSNKNLNIDNMGFTKRGIPNSVLNSDKYAMDVKFTGYSYKTIHVDLAASYAPLSVQRSKLSPYIFAGPSIVIMRTNEMGIAVSYRESSQEPWQDMTRYSVLQRPLAMIAINAGMGIQYDTGKRLTFSLSGKYIHGIFPKLINPDFSDKTEGSIPMPDEAWGQLHHRFQDAYDQYTRIVTITGAVNFRI